MMTSSMRI